MVTRRALAALLLSWSGVITSATNSNSNGDKNLGKGPSVTLIDQPPSGGSPRRLASSWPWIQPGGASTTTPLVLSQDEELGSVEVTMEKSSEIHMSDQDSPFFRDITMLTDILLDVVKDEDEKIHDLYLEFLKYGKERYVESLFQKSL